MVRTATNPQVRRELPPHQEPSHTSPCLAAIKTSNRANPRPVFFCRKRVATRHASPLRGVVQFEREERGLGEFHSQAAEYTDIGTSKSCSFVLTDIENWLSAHKSNHRNVMTEASAYFRGEDCLMIIVGAAWKAHTSATEAVEPGEILRNVPGTTAINGACGIELIAFLPWSAHNVFPTQLPNNAGINNPVWRDAVHDRDGRQYVIQRVIDVE